MLTGTPSATSPRITGSTRRSSSAASIRPAPGPGGLAADVHDVRAAARIATPVGDGVVEIQEAAAVGERVAA